VGLPPAAEAPTELPHGRIIGLAEEQPRLRILIAEDQHENLLLLRKQLEPLGFDLREAVNGQEAVEIFEQWHPHLIWMDVRMPVMDGLTATRRIKATGDGACTKIIALTAHALEEERREILAAGCDDFIRKPYREAEIFEVMAKHLGLRYVYEGELETPSGYESELHPEQLAALPADLLERLHQAVVELDILQTRELIAQITACNASAGNVMETLASRFEYDRLLKLLERTEPGPSSGRE
jgi:CheY-like chemotaxis protein